MAKEVTMPKLGKTMSEGTIVNTLVRVGDNVHKGDVLFEVETDKAAFEVESPADGCVKVIIGQNGQTLPVNAPLLILGGEHETVDYAVQEGAAVEQSAGGLNSPPFATVEVETTAPSPVATRACGPAIPVNRLQHIVAEKMLWSKRNIPCFYLNIRADVTALLNLRSKLNKTAAVKLSFNDFILKALAVGIQHYPIMTGQLAGDYIQLADSLDIGLAISTDDGLVAPIVPDCGNKTLHDIAAYVQTLIERAHSGKLTPDDVQGGCITVSNLGGLGIDSFIPIVIPGQTSILGVGAVVDMVVPSDGNLLVRKLMNLTLSVDHKVVNGAEAAQFLDFVKKHLEHPETLVD